MDNLYPNNGEYFTPKESDEQKADRQQEQSDVTKVLPIVKDLIAHMETRIAYRDSIKSVTVDIAENPELHQKTCAVNDMLADALREEKRLLEEVISEHDK